MSQSYIGQITDTSQVSGDDLAQMLNQFDAAHKTNQSGTNRPVDIEPGGIWTRDNAGQFDVMMYDGSTDRVIQRGDTNLAGLTNAGTARSNLGLAYASAAEATAGTRSDRVMSPLRTKEAIAAAGGVPLGTIMWFPSETPPDGWLVCNGSVVTALYPDLRLFLLAAGSPFGVTGPDPRLPDLRGQFVRGWDNGRGLDAGRVFGSAQGDAIRNIVGKFDPGGNIGGKGTDNYTGPFQRESTPSLMSNEGGRSDARFVTFDASRTVPTANENRPRNVALLPCIRAYASVVNVPGQSDLNNILQQTQAMANSAESAAVGKILGVGQVWRNVTANRIANTDYLNSTGRTIAVSIVASAGTNTGFILQVGGMSMSRHKITYNSGSPDATGFAVVPSGVTYKLTNAAGTISWYELY